jgi:hypothetical protein
MSESRAPSPSPTAVRVALRAIVIAYLVLGAMYAVATPPWQVPDEPAHYNYVRHVALYGTLPELRPGDYPAAYLEEIKARRFAPELSIEPIRYESHQPPLYYILAAALYRAASSLALPDLVVLRAFSVFLGALTLLVAFQLVHALRPRDPVLALGATAFAASLPMHIAMTAAVNNDVLAGLFVATIAWRLIPMTADDWTPRRALGLGALLGLAFLTKMQSYVAFAMVAMALLWDLGYAQRWRPLGGWRRVARIAAIIFATSLLMALPWLLRNVHLYGLADPLGLARHDRVVAGQLTTAEFLAQHGWPALVRSFLRTTFQSFWGVFGWMGVPMHSRVYHALGGLTLLSALGLGLYAWRARNRSRLPEAEGLQVAGDRLQATASAHPHAWNLEPVTCNQPASHPDRRRATRGLALLLVWVLGTGAGYLWWNASYLQHQGRYLFPAIVPIGLAATVGLREVYQRPPRYLLPALGLGLAALVVVGMALGDVAWFAVALAALAGVAVWTAQRLESRWPGSALVVTYAAMAALTLFALHAYVIPYLTP